MTFLDFLNFCEIKKISFALVDSQLKINAPKNVLTPEIVEQLKSFKPQLIDWLSTQNNLGEKSGVVQHSLPGIECVTRQEKLLTSFAQEQLWLSHQLDDVSDGYHFSRVLVLNGQLNNQALNAAISDIINRHEALRTVFSDNDGSVYQTVLPATSIQQNTLITDHDVSYHAISEKEPLIQSLEHSFSVKAFDLSNDLMIRIQLIKVTETHHRLMIVLHHIASDGWSLGVLVNELQALYNHYDINSYQQANSQVNNQNVLANLPVQYIDYAAWQRSEEVQASYKASLNFWQEYLSNAPLVHSIPTSFPRPPQQTYQASSVNHVISLDELEKLKHIANRSGSTLFIVLETLIASFIARYSGTNDIVIGTPVANRSDESIAGLIGYFVNMLALRNTIDIKLTLLEQIELSKKTILAAFEQQSCPFLDVVKQVVATRSTSYSPLVQIAFTLQNNAIAELSLNNITCQIEQQERANTTFDLNIEATELGDGLQIDWEYSTALFSELDMQKMVAHFHAFLGYALADIDKPLGQIPLLSEQEYHQQVIEWNATQVNYSPQSTKLPSIHQLFEQQALNNPNAIALIFDEQQLTYQQLNAQANQLAHYLITSQAVTPDTLVGVSLPRSLEMVISVLAILKAGGAYVPLDPSYPEARLHHMVQDSALKLVLTHHHLTKMTAFNAVQTIALDDNELFLHLATYSRQNPDIDCFTEQNLAYVIYTSGSTGKPKGVMIEHQQLSNFILSMQDAPGCHQQDSLLAVTSLSFDIHTLELYLPLVCGAKLVIAGNEQVTDAIQLMSLIEQHNISLMQATPSTWKMLLSQSWQAKTKLKLLCGGEPLSEQLKASLTVMPNVELWNMYGPTETCVWSTTTKLTTNTNVSLGRPISNTQCYVLNECLELSPVGVSGELYIGGLGLARGYLKQPELTAERFIDNPFYDATNSTSSPRLYKTGDLVCWLPNGELSFIGRVDQQVKIRGFRIEVGEIEYAIAKQQDIKDVVVDVVDSEQGDKRLVAYVVHNIDELKQTTEVSDIKTQQLREQLAEFLPDYMVPSAFVWLTELPLTPNGKVDRKALPKIDVFQQTDHYIAPNSETEKALCDIWQEVLAVKQIGIENDFFELGGHSLLATRLIAKINQQFDVQLEIKVVFSYPTIRLLAQQVEKSQRHQYPMMVSISRKEPILLSYAQQRLWLQDKINGDSSHYNIFGALQLSGQLNKAALQQAFQSIIERHESLRSYFIEETAGQPRQVIQNNVVIDITHYDISNYSINEQQVELTTYLASEASTPFNLSQDLMVRVGLIKIAEFEHILMVTLHHIAADGWSIDILLKEFSVLYQAYKQGQNNPLKRLTFQYADYAAWQRNWLQGQILEELSSYWQEQLAGIPMVHSLPLDRPRPKVQSFNGERCFSLINVENSEQLNQFCLQKRVTLFMALHSVFSALIARFSNETDIVIGSPIANREQSDIANMIGFFVNTLVLRSDLSENPSFDELLVQTKQVLLDAYEHQHLPFEQIVEQLDVARNLSHSPVFQVMLILQNNDTELSTLADLDVTQLPQQNKLAKYDLTLNVQPQKSGLQLEWEYNSDLFKHKTIECLATSFECLLMAMLQAPENSVFSASLLTIEEQNLQLATCNNNALYQSVMVEPSSTCIHQLFEQQVLKTPDNIAVIFDERSLTYQELNQQANQLAGYLIEHHDIKPDQLIGVCLERSSQMLIAVLAILKAGGAYVPLDPNYPKGRLTHMMQDSGLALVLSTQKLWKNIAVNNELLTDIKEIILDNDVLQSQLQHYQKSDLTHIKLSAHQLAYVIYTSGSTGQPKGVMIEHSSVVNFLLSMQVNPGIQPEDKLLSVTTISFDIHVLELYLPLISGAQLTIATGDQSTSGKALSDIITTQQITMMQATPATWRMLIDSHWRYDAAEQIFKVLCGGEAWPEGLKQALLASGNVELWNMYGPTETTVWSSVAQISEQVQLGKPIANTCIYILNQQLELQPFGVAGELYLGGKGLSRGYLNQPELTAERFIDNPFYDATNPASSARLYKTGDLARCLPDGSLMYLGRLDHQVKVFGFRIELGEIEAQLLTHPQVKETVVVSRETSAGNNQLVSYVVPETTNLIEKNSVDFSLFYFGGDTYSQENKYELYLASAKFADDNGFDAIWTPERHFDKIGSLYPNPSVLSAALATITKRINLRAGSVVLPLHDPIRVAEEWAVVDNLSQGRIGMALAVGWHTRDFVLAPENFDNRREKILKATEELKTLWAGEKITRLDGKGNEVEVQVFPKPIQKNIPLWITAAGNPETFIEAGRQGSHLLTHLLGQTHDELSKNIALYRESLAKHGHDPQQGRVTLMIHTYLGADQATTVAQAKAPFIHYMKGHIALLQPLLKSLGLEDNTTDNFEDIAGFAFERYVNASSFIGTPDNAVGVMESLIEAGVDEFSCLIDWIDNSLALNGLPYINELFKRARTLPPNRRLLKEHCANNLPQYMVPAHWVFLNELPLTPNGKVDRNALPEPDLLSQQATYVAPSNDIEQQLADIWQTLLDIESIGILDNFFELGGHSLLATQLIEQVNQTFGCALKLENIFKAQTIESLANEVNEHLVFLSIQQKEDKSLLSNEMEVTI